MRMWPNLWLVVAGLAVHLVFFYSIFDIYFTSPLVHGMTPQVADIPPPAQRLVLFVADGLRADKLFELDDKRRSRAPYVRDVIERRGAWGVSHTHVPTESRPGHVAIIAGFYEDVSAVAKGWKENPVEFDSLFNESRHTWSWGSPDILPMFAKGASGNHVHMHMYPAESEDFAGSDLSQLDTWVFDNLMDMLAAAHHNETLHQALHQDRIIFFLHLLGMDTNGHAHRPYSKEYLENLGVVDRGVEQIVVAMDEFYNHDNLTSYILTSDHGMTSWGSHGAGHPDETLTPVVGWGAGIRHPEAPGPGDTYFDGLDDEWNLTHLKRADVNQADLCPLMASLIGTPYPLNSVGMLPLDYLSGSDQYKAEVILTNARQLVKQFEVKMALKKETTLSVLFTPFKELTPLKLSMKQRYIRHLIDEEKFLEAIGQAQHLIRLSLEGLTYYHNYDRLFLGASIAFGFTGWMGYIAVLMFERHTDLVRPRPEVSFTCSPYIQTEKGIRLIFSVIGAIVLFLLYVQSLQWTHYVYCLIPIMLWHAVFQKFRVIVSVWHYVHDHGMLLQVLITLCFGIIGLEIIVMSFRMRELLSVGLVTMSVWPFGTRLWESYKSWRHRMTRHAGILLSSTNMSGAKWIPIHLAAPQLTWTRRQEVQFVCYGWFVSCLVLALFPLLPVVGRDANYALVIVAGCLVVVVGLTCTLRPESRIFLSSKTDADLLQVRLLTVLQLVTACVSVYLVRSTAISISSKQGLPFYNQVASWIILGMAFVLPVLSSTKLYTRLLNIALAFLPPYLLLSTAHESLFVLALCTLLFCWLQLEHRLNHQKPTKLTDLDFGGGFIGHVQRHLMLADVRIAFFFIFFLILAFFGTGNIASINSFDPSSVYCFLTVFNPFVMGALMMWKILIPFLFVSVIFNAIHVTVNIPTHSLILIVTLMSDFMALHFFFMVRDYGSWLDIGTSISHYVIVMSTICFTLILLVISKIFTNVSLRLIKHKTQ